MDQLKGQHLLMLAGFFTIVAALMLRGGGVGEPVEALKSYVPSTHGQLNECDGRSRCLVVYLAPWCGACRNAKGFLQAFDAYSRQDGDIGLKVVVGRDGRDSIDQFAAAIPLNVYLDYDGVWSKAFGSSVPGWVVLDDQGRLLKRDAGLYASSPTDLRTAEHFAKRYL